MFKKITVKRLNRNKFKFRNRSSHNEIKLEPTFLKGKLINTRSLFRRIAITIIISNRNLIILNRFKSRKDNLNR
jgi:hypothetical protein